MRKSLRVNVAVPCGQDWDTMLPVEKGRHCQQCCKTVVDFTGMSDAEVVGFFKERARTAKGGVPEVGGVCGRFMADQLGRDLAPLVVQRNGMKGWSLVVAGALALGKGPGGGGPVKAGTEVRRTMSASGGNAVSHDIDTFRPVMMGSTPVVLNGDVVVQGEPEAVLIGKVAPDSLAGEMPVDTMKALVQGKPEDEALTGVVIITGDSVTCTGKRVDTASRVKVLLDSVLNTIKDSVVAVVPRFESLVSGAQRADLLDVYPNPVSRGGMIRLAWRTGAGNYSVALLNSAGQVVQERMVTVEVKQQVDKWSVPGWLPAGVYFLRVGEQGGGVKTVKMLIE